MFASKQSSSQRLLRAECLQRRRAVTRIAAPSLAVGCGWVWGSQFTPRIGAEVLIDFMDGDMDQPVIVGQLYNGVDTPPFAAGVDSGVNHGGVISGWHSFAGEQLHIISQGDSHYAAAHTLAAVSGKGSTLYTHEGGLEAVAANGPLSLQAHTDQLELLADKEVTVVSVNDSISINAKTKIVLKAGQTSITLDGANITFACPGTFSVKGSAHSLDSGASSAAEMKILPDSRTILRKFDEQFRAIDDKGKSIRGLAYKIYGSDGLEYLSGVTDKEGKTERITTENAVKLHVIWDASSVNGK